MEMMNWLHGRAIGFVLAGILFYFPLPSVAGNATTFPSVEAMIEEFNDYSASNGTFKILATDPLHIQFSPQITQAHYHNPEDIEDEVRRALVYGFYRAFIHTPVNQITVTAVPREINVKTRKTRYVSGYKRTIGKTRAEALALAKKYLRISSFSDLVTETKVADMVFPNHWSKDFDRLYYNEQGYPGIRHFVGELAK